MTNHDVIKRLRCKLFNPSLLTPDQQNELMWELIDALEWECGKLRRVECEDKARIKSLVLMWEEVNAKCTELRALQLKALRELAQNKVAYERELIATTEHLTHEITRLKAQFYEALYKVQLTANNHG